MSIAVQTDLDFGGINEIQNAVFQNLASAPATNLSGGRFYFSTADNTLYVYNGTTWVNALGQGTAYTAGSGIDITTDVISIDSTTLAAIGTISDKIELTDLSIASGSANYLSYDNATGEFSANVDTTVGTVSTNLVTSGAVQTAISNAISSVYKAAGSVAFASLPTLGSSIEGNVYNVTDAFTTTSDFVEGAGESYPAGTNVVCINTSGTTYKWDVLAGFVDTSSFITASSTDTLTNKTINAANNTITGVTKKITANNPALTASSGVCTWTISNTLGSADVLVSVIDASTNKVVITDITVGSSTITVKFNSTSNISANAYKAIIIGE